MPSSVAADERTAHPLPPGLIAARLVSRLSTGSFRSLAALDEKETATAPATNPPATATGFYRPSTALRHTYVTGSLTMSAAVAGRITPLAVTEPDDKERMREQIRAIMMETDDGVEDGRPSPAAISDALRFIDLLPADGPMPHVAVADDGEVNFFRRREGLFVDVGFFGDGQIHYYARVESQGIDVDGSEPFSGRSLPRDLVIPIIAR